MELKQDAETIRKAMVQINALAGSTAPQDLNQLVRWIDTKDEHADKMITTTAESPCTARTFFRDESRRRRGRDADRPRPRVAAAPRT